MHKIIKLTLLSITLMLGLTVSSVLSGAALAQSNSTVSDKLCESSTNLQLPSNTGTFTDTNCATAAANTNTRFNNLITNVVNIFSLIVGIIAVIMIIIGGFKYITSGGDSGNVTGAKNTIMYAIVGLIIVALAQFIVRFVLAKATNIETT